MAVPFSNTKLRVPKGFRNLIWVVSKEVIRDAPENVMTYCADFFEKLLQIRADTGHDPAKDGAHGEDRFYNNYAFKKSAQLTSEDLVDIDLSDPEVQDAATKIQAQFRGHLVRRQSKSLSLEHSTGELEKPAQNGGDSEELVDIDLSDPAVQDAATKIQAQFRGLKIGRNSKSQSPERSTE